MNDTNSYNFRCCRFTYILVSNKSKPNEVGSILEKSKGMGGWLVFCKKSRSKADFAPTWLGWRDSNPRMTESKSVALPLGYTPLSGTAKSRRETPPKRLAVARRLCPARIRRLKLGWMEGIEPSGAGATIRCVNRFATSTTHNKYGIKTADACQEHF